MNGKYFIILFLILGCREPFDFQIEATEEFLVVNASLTNLEATSFVRLSKSVPLLGDPSLPTVEADVYVEDLNGIITPFIKRSPGFYTPDSLFTGKVGMQYRLSVIMDDGRRYLSTYEELMEPVEMDSIYGRFISVASTVDQGQDQGVQFYVDVGDPTKNVSSYRYEYVEHYQISMPYQSAWIYSTEDSLQRRAISIRDCYNSVLSSELNIANTGGQIQNFLSAHPIRFIKPNEMQLVTKYSITVKQYSITPQTYQYYQDLKENNESSGSFFDRQKGVVTGNITSVNNPEETILGYFEVAGISKKTRFFLPSNFRQQGFITQNPFESCFYDLVADTIPVIDIVTNQERLGNRNIYLISILDDGSSVAILIPEPCIDCRNYGSLKKPDFWD